MKCDHCDGGGYEVVYNALGGSYRVPCRQCKARKDTTKMESYNERMNAAIETEAARVAARCDGDIDAARTALALCGYDNAVSAISVVADQLIAFYGKGLFSPRRAPSPFMLHGKRGAGLDNE